MLANRAANQHMKFIGTTQFSYQNISKVESSGDDSLYE